jgi:hypothetical protein
VPIELISDDCDYISDNDLPAVMKERTPVKANCTPIARTTKPINRVTTSSTSPQITQIKGEENWRMDEFLYKDETYRIIGACFEVYNEKGCEFLEPVYQECLDIELSLHTREVAAVGEMD